MVSEDNFILAADNSEAAVPLGFFLEPFILSAFGAGVWAADFLPLRFAIQIFFQIYFFFLKKAYFWYLRFILNYYKQTKTNKHV